MSTIRFDTWQNVGGTAEFYKCRAWVNFNGTGTIAIRAAGNVSSITDNGVGLYRINFTTAMPDVNYTYITGVGRNLDPENSANVLNGRLIANQTTTFLDIQGVSTNAVSSSIADFDVACVAIFR